MVTSVTQQKLETLVGTQLLTTYCFIRAGEVWAVQLIYSHNDSNQIFAIQDGCRKDVFCSVVGELINKWAELGTLFNREFTNKHFSQCVLKVSLSIAP